VQDERDRFAERAIADERHLAAERPVGVLVADRDRMDVRAVRHRGLEKRAVELAQLVAFCGDAFREEPHAIALAHHFAHARVDARHVAHLVAADEERAGAIGDPARERPRADLALGHEARGAHARDEHDVDERDVVGRDHRGVLAARRRLAFDPHLDVEDREELRAPTLHQRAPPLGRGARIQEP